MKTLRLCLSTLAAFAALALAPASSLAEPSAEAPPRVLGLADAERMALEHQPQVRVARAQTDTAEAQAEQAGAPLLPQVTATAQYQRTTSNYAPRPGQVPPGVTGTPSTNLDPQYDAWSFGVNATQLIYDFGQTPERHRAASATVDALRTTERSTRLQILANVRRAFFAARAMKDLVRVARETLDDQQKHLDQVQAFVAVGTQPYVALAQQKAALANARVQLIAAENNYETSKAQLNQAAGMPRDTAYDVADDDLGPLEDEEQPLDALVARAIAARPELAALQKQRLAAQATLSSVRGSYGPTLSAAANATEVGVALDRMAPNWNVGVLLNWPLFQGGLTQGAVHQAQAGLQTIDAQTALEELQVRLDVDTARLAVRAAKATIGASDEALASAREQLRLAEQRYATAVGSIIELYDAQVAYTTAAAQAVQARYGLAAARAQLLAALGRA